MADFYSRGDNVIHDGSAEDDVFHGSDTVNDAFSGMAGDDVLYGKGGNDFFFGNAGDDILWGGEDHDWLTAADGDDFVYGEAGDDTVIGGGGDDTLDGGEGSDRIIVFTDAADPVRLTLAGSEDAVVYVGGVAEGTVRNVENIESWTGDDVLVGDDGDNGLDGGPGGRDELTGRGGADHFGLSVHRGHIVHDFNSSENDKLDLGPINEWLQWEELVGRGSSNRVTFNGDISKEFSAWYEDSKDKNGITLKADVDGDYTTVEFSVALPGVTGLTADDFI